MNYRKAHCTTFYYMLAMFLPLILAGCSTQQPQQTIALPTAPVKAPDYPVRAFPEGAVYDLLVGEFAGIRNEFDVALETYLRQARATKDPGVIERAAHIANYVGDNDAMLELSQLWLANNPNEPEAHRMAAFSLARAGKVLEAYPHAEFLMENGETEHLRTLAAFAEDMKSEERQQLLLIYQRLALRKSDDAALQLGLAMLQRQQGELDNALATSQRLVAQVPEDEPAALLVAQLLHQMGRSEQALTALEKSLISQPDSKRLRLQYARLLAETNLSASRNQMALLVQKFPQDPDLVLSLALIEKEVGRRDQAGQLLQSLIDKKQRVADAHFQLARMAEEDGQKEEALKHYRQVRQGQNFLAAAARITRLMADNGKVEEARLYLHRLRGEQPNMAIPIYQLESDLLMQQQRYQTAYKLLSDGLGEHPQNITLLYSRSLVSEQLKDIASVESDLRAILALDAQNATALNALGYSLANHTSRYEEAYTLIKQALELHPEDPAIMDSLGWVLYRMGKYEEAISYLRQALTALPDPEVSAHLGEVLWMNGNREEARVIWQEAMQKSPEHPILQETVQRLQSGV